MTSIVADRLAQTAALQGDGRGSQVVQRTKQRSRRIAADVVGFMDVVAVVVGGLIPAIIYSVAGGLEVDWLKHLQMCLVSALIVYGCLRHYNLYDTARMHDFPLQPRLLAFSLGIAFLAILGLGLPFAPKDMHLWIWYGAWIATSFMMLLAMRLIAREVLANMTRAGAFDQRVAVYGSGTIARRVEEHLRDPESGIKFAGVFDDRHDTTRVDQQGPELSGRLEDLIAGARAGHIDQIVIALPQSADQRTMQIARKLEHLPVSLHVVTHIASDLVEDVTHRVSNLGSVGLIDVKKKPLADWSRVVKAVEDYTLGTLLLIVFLPVMALVSLAIRLDSAGPVLFKQRRRGLNGNVIEVFKFRSMHVVEDGEAMRQARPGDPRVTRVGRVLRRLSLDELPQLFNVLRGEMSVVGPRPHALAHDDHFGETVARYANRYQVKPGITGLAQVSGLRGETETPEKIEQRLMMDLAYVGSWSLWEDVRILGKTVICVLSGRNAY